MARFFWYALTSSNINRFSKLFHDQIRRKFVIILSLRIPRCFLLISLKCVVTEVVLFSIVALRHLTFHNVVYIRVMPSSTEPLLYRDSYMNKTGIKAEQLQVFQSVGEITEYLYVDAHAENFTSLSFLRNLRVIHGRKTYASRQVWTVCNAEHVQRENFRVSLAQLLSRVVAPSLPPLKSLFTKRDMKFKNRFC